MMLPPWTSVRWLTSRANFISCVTTSIVRASAGEGLHVEHLARARGRARWWKLVHGAPSGPIARPARSPRATARRPTSRGVGADAVREPDALEQLRAYASSPSTSPFTVHGAS